MLRDEWSSIIKPPFQIALWIAHRPTTSTIFSGWHVITPASPKPVEVYTTKEHRANVKVGSTTSPSPSFLKLPSERSVVKNSSSFKSDFDHPDLAPTRSDNQGISLAPIARCGSDFAVRDLESPQSAQHSKYTNFTTGSSPGDHDGKSFAQLDRLHGVLPSSSTSSPVDLALDEDFGFALSIFAGQVENDATDPCALPHSLSDDWFDDEMVEVALVDPTEEASREREDAGVVKPKSLQRKADQHGALTPHVDKNLMPLTPISANKSINRRSTAVSGGQENEFSDPELDASMADLVPFLAHQITTPVSTPQRTSSPKLDLAGMKIVAQQKGPENQLVKSPNSVPVAEIYGIQFNAANEPLSFTRPPFPKRLSDRSSIPGFSNCTVLRVCFRIGEALNAASAAFRSGIDAIIELYARVVTSSRKQFKQNFLFADIFTDKPPYLNGAYTIWKDVELWDNDASSFLGPDGEGRLCRVLGRIKREKGTESVLSVLNIWPCSWEDIGVAKKIVCC
ncbi:uncharacterized protein KY384_002592 [Bacidia gigantensis]|uniref:uncharacterized protein n=1 Tax=Bacidia gigantensis TaxID=2732470 RepID=UPI001D05099A|nr:uncharacterized protein KY384_002592 [Bacidia gigantensis]KAG8532715.1 hypothetical protein KY384_002592 [Bacidia gigantensis]